MNYSRHIKRTVINHNGASTVSYYSDGKFGGLLYEIPGYLLMAAQRNSNKHDPKNRPNFHPAGKLLTETSIYRPPGNSGVIMGTASAAV